MTTESLGSSTNPLKLGVSLVIGYFRWSQLTPMIVVWGFGLLMLAAMFFVNNQEATFDMVGSVSRWIAGLPVVGDAFVQWGESLAGEDGTLELGGKDLEAALLKVWSGLSLVFFVLSLIAGWLFGPFKPWSLKRKLAFAGLGSVILIAAFAMVYFLDPSQFNGPAWNWMLMFSGVGILLFIVSAWCLSIAHLLGWVARLVAESELGEPKKPEGLI